MCTRILAAVDGSARAGRVGHEVELHTPTSLLLVV